MNACKWEWPCCRQMAAVLALLLGAAVAPGQPTNAPAQSGAIDVVRGQKPAEMFGLGDAENVQIFLGESYKLNVHSVEKIVISDPEIVEVVPVSTEVLVLNAKKAGTTILTLFEESGERQVRVLVAHNDLALAMRVKNAIGYPEVNVLIAEENIILEGEVEDQDERNRAVSIASAFLAAVRPSQARTAGAANVYNTTQFPSGDNTSEGDVADAVSYKVPTPDGILDFLRVRNQKQIKIRIVVVALTKDGAKEFGIQFGDQVIYGLNYTESMIGGPTPGGHSWLANQTRNLIHGTVAPEGSDVGYQVTLHTLESHGDAKVLAKPVVMTLDGAEGSFLAGGKVILTTSSVLGGVLTTSTQTEEFGVKVFFRPKIMANGNINMFITPKVSEVPIEFAEGSFRIDSRNTRNNVEVRPGDTIVLSGLFRLDESLDESKFPWLADVPILGYLFKSTRRGKRLSEVMFLVSPEVVDSPVMAAVDGSLETEMGETKVLLQRGRAFASVNPELASKGPKFEPRQYAAAEPMTLAEAERTAREARGQAGPYTIEEIPLDETSPRAVKKSASPKKVAAPAPAPMSSELPPPAAAPKVGTIQPIPMEEVLPAPAAALPPSTPPAMAIPAADSPLNNLPRPVAPTLRPR